MDHSPTILPGDVEGYCLGLLSEQESKAVAEQARLHNTIKAEVDDFMASLEAYVRLNEVAPPVLLKNEIFSLLSNLQTEENRNIDILPVINKYTDFRNWLQIVKPVLPLKQPEGMFIHELRNDASFSQTLLYAAIDYPDEVHHDEQECFIILQGKCRCFVGDEVIELEAGSFFEIPLHVHHNVEIIEPVIAVVQRKKIA